MRTGELPCDVERVLTTVCQNCHTSPPKNDAPFPLVTYANTQAMISGKPVYEYMRAALESGRMPLDPITIAPRDREVLLAWLRADAPPRRSGEGCPPQRDASDELDGDARPTSNDASGDAPPDKSEPFDATADVHEDVLDASVD